MKNKFQLVASRYDRSKKEYLDEKSIKIEGIKFDGIEDIDRFTAGLTKYQFLNLLGDKFNDMNSFAIKISNIKRASYNTSIIYDNDLLIEIIDSIVKCTYKTPFGYRTIKKITCNSKLFEESWNEVYNLIVNKDLESLSAIFHEKSEYTFMLRRAINSDSNSSSYYKELAELETSFRSYDVFRKYLVNKDKVSKPSLTPSNIKNLNIQDYDYTTNCVIINYKLIPDNSDIDDEKEEFFEDDEIKSMYPDDSVPKHGRCFHKI